VKLPFPFQDGETPVALARRHGLFVYPKLALGGTVALVPVAALFYLLGRLGRLDDDSLLWIALGVSALWLIYWAVRLYFFKYRYDNDIWAVTNQRLVDSTKRHWLHVQVATTDLADIEDMTVVRQGLLATLFDFGDIQCQTAGAVRQFAVQGVPKPRELQALIHRLRDQARTAKLQIDTPGGQDVK